MFQFLRNLLNMKSWFCRHDFMTLEGHANRVMLDLIYHGESVKYVICKKCGNSRRF